MSYSITIADVAGIVTACATVYLTFKANQNIGLILEDKETLYNTSSKPITTYLLRDSILSKIQKKWTQTLDNLKST